MNELDERYAERLKRFQDEDRAGAKSDHMGPSERAYEELAREMSKDLGPIGWEALRNKHSASRTGKLHPIENHADSEDYEAEIDRQFPAPDRS